MKCTVAFRVYADVCLASLAVGINQKSVFGYIFFDFFISGYFFHPGGYGGTGPPEWPIKKRNQ
jgi:hypothetical protein